MLLAPFSAGAQFFGTGVVMVGLRNKPASAEHAADALKCVSRLVTIKVHTDAAVSLFPSLQPFPGRGTGSWFGPFGFALRQRQTAERMCLSAWAEGDRPMFAAKRVFPSPPSPSRRENWDSPQ
jgi:hypothetical protein